MLNKIADDQYRSDVRELKAFLYILMRDHLPSGIVHEILIKQTSVGDPNTKSVYSNPFLAADALKCAEAILSHTTFKEVLQSKDQNTLEERVQMERANDPRDW